MKKLILILSLIMFSFELTYSQVNTYATLKDVAGYSISEIRALSHAKVLSQKTFYCSENGKEGFFKYDATDNSSVDNASTIIVTGASDRLKYLTNYKYFEDTETDKVLNSFTIATWGDSFTQGAGGTPYTETLSKYSGKNVFNGGIGGESSTSIKNRMVLASDKFSFPTIIWAGRNNYTNATTVKSDIASMVSLLTTPNYLILGVVNSSTEPINSSEYLQIKNLNLELKAIYKEKFFDVQKFLVSSYNPAISQDVLDFNNDIPPTSLRSDNLHLNSQGYFIVGKKIYNDFFSILFNIENKKYITGIESINRIVNTNYSTKDAKINGITIGLGGSNNGVNAFDNQVFGVNAGKNLSSGTNNLIIGSNAGLNNTISSNNTFIGFRAGYSNTIGTSNTFLGYQSGNFNIGSNNMYIGHNAGYFGSNVTDNTYIGYNAGFSNVSGNSIIAIGSLAGYNNTASNNTFIGKESGTANTSGAGNLFVGFRAGFKNTSNNGSTYIGFQSGNNATGALNTFLGQNSGYSNTTGETNTFIGNSSGFSTTGGSRNNLLGYNSGYGNTTGSNNIYIGYNSAFNTTTGSSNIALGSYVDNVSPTNTGQLNIGNVVYGNNLYSLTTNSSAPVDLGQIAIGTSTLTTSAKFEVNSTTKGFLSPRVTTFQKNLIAGAVDGLQVYDIDLKHDSYYDGNQWLSKLPAKVYTTFASIGTLSDSNIRLLIVKVDETNGNLPTMYMYDGAGGIHWIPTNKIN